MNTSPDSLLHTVSVDSSLFSLTLGIAVDGLFIPMGIGLLMLANLIFGWWWYWWDGVEQHVA